jgi:quinol monooxygenase YgiN
MVVVRLKAHCQAGKTEHVLAVLAGLIAPSRAVPGVVSFDIGRDIDNPDAAIIVAVFADVAALRHHGSLAEVRQSRHLLPRLITSRPELQVFEVVRVPSAKG